MQSETLEINALRKLYKDLSIAILPKKIPLDLKLTFLGLQSLLDGAVSDLTVEDLTQAYRLYDHLVQQHESKQFALTDLTDY